MRTPMARAAGRCVVWQSGDARAHWCIVAHVYDANPRSCAVRRCERAPRSVERRAALYGEEVEAAEAAAAAAGLSGAATAAS